jgi:hypothetical protein
MGAAEVVGILVAIVALGGVAWYLTTRRRRSEALRAQYGPEYSRTLNEAGSQRVAEEELLRRQERVELLEIRPLLAEQRQLFAQQWRGVQSLFVDDPGAAVRKADGLVEEVMKTRGYPVADFDQRTADLSVHHALVVQNYRAARDIAERYRRGAASTEDLRRSMVYYRELFKDLLEDRERGAQRSVERSVERPVERDDQRFADTTPAEERARVEQQRTIRVDKDLRP